MVCGVCGRPFSTLSAPAIYPNMSIVHVACAQRSCPKCDHVMATSEHTCNHCFSEVPTSAPLNIDPITRTNFTKKISSEEGVTSR
jgi:hypothetical protein